MHKDIENQRLEKTLASIRIIDKTIFLEGDWCWKCINQDIIESIKVAKQSIDINASSIDKLDTTGAYFIAKLCNNLKHENIKINNIYLNKNQETLYKLIANKAEFSKEEKTNFSPFETASHIGLKTSQYVYDSVQFIGFIGQVTQSSIETARSPLKVRGRLILDVVYNAGYKAIGIICLLSFLIGVVLAYQIGTQLMTYGANIYVVNLLGVSLLREFAPLITSIIVAGRSGSAFAAQIGTMKVQEEVDALQTFGIPPIKRLVLPRIVGLLIALPLLVVLADIASVAGGMIMSKASLGLSFYEFIYQFGKGVSSNSYLIGLIKTPVFAIIIAMVGCYRGLKVQGHANSIGEETTKSVVYSIFLIIIADAIFSIMFSSIGV